MVIIVQKQIENVTSTLAFHAHNNVSEKKNPKAKFVINRGFNAPRWVTKNPVNNYLYHFSPRVFCFSWLFYCTKGSIFFMRFLFLYLSCFLSLFLCLEATPIFYFLDRSTTKKYWSCTTVSRMRITNGCSRVFFIAHDTKKRGIHGFIIRHFWRAHLVLKWCALYVDI